ncbi:MAG: serine/threonine-protein kinase [Kofleriaceae bacterium]
MHSSARPATDTWSGPTVVEPRPRGRDHGPRRTGERLGDYEVECLLGEGGMASVYLARHVVIDRPVAIKRLAPELADLPEAQAAFLQEARITGAARHPGVVEVFDYGFDERQRPYFVMELARGTTLTERLARGPLSLAYALEIAIGVTDALAAVHRAGFVHRDVKSDNVMLTDDGRRYVPLLIDFGIACSLGEAGLATAAGVVGTPRIMAPEQVAREPVDGRADVWGVGVLLYEMIAGQLPFAAGETWRDDLLAVVTEPARPLPDDVHPELAALIDECLRKDPDERPGSAEGLLEELRWVQALHLAAVGLTARRWHPTFT